MCETVKIIAEPSGDQWKAWFDDAPEVATSGIWPGEAILRLLNQSGGEHFDMRQFVPIDDQTRDGHLVFRIPSCGRIQIQGTSVKRTDGQL